MHLIFIGQQSDKTKNPTTSPSDLQDGASVFFFCRIFNLVFIAFILIKIISK